MEQEERSRLSALQVSRVVLGEPGTLLHRVFLVTQCSDCSGPFNPTSGRRRTSIKVTVTKTVPENAPKRIETRDLEGPTVALLGSANALSPDSSGGSQSMVEIRDVNSEMKGLECRDSTLNVAISPTARPPLNRLRCARGITRGLSVQTCSPRSAALRVVSARDDIPLLATGAPLQLTPRPKAAKNALSPRLTAPPQEIANDIQGEPAFPDPMGTFTDVSRRINSSEPGKGSPKGSLINMVCIVPRGTWGMAEVAQDEPFHPLRFCSVQVVPGARPMVPAWPKQLRCHCRCCSPGRAHQPADVDAFCWKSEGALAGSFLGPSAGPAAGGEWAPCHFPDNLEWNLGVIPQTWQECSSSPRSQELYRASSNGDGTSERNWSSNSITSTSSSGSNSSGSSGVGSSSGSGGSGVGGSGAAECGGNLQASHHGAQMEVVEVGCQAAELGEVYAVQAIGAVLVARGHRQLVWVAVAVRVGDPLLAGIEGQTGEGEACGALLQSVRMWLDSRAGEPKLPSVGPASSAGRACAGRRAMSIIKDAHVTWAQLRAVRLLPFQAPPPPQSPLGRPGSTALGLATLAPGACESLPVGHGLPPISPSQQVSPSSGSVAVVVSPGAASGWRQSRLALSPTPVQRRGQNSQASNQGGPQPRNGLLRTGSGTILKHKLGDAASGELVSPSGRRGAGGPEADPGPGGFETCNQGGVERVSRQRSSVEEWQRLSALGAARNRDGVAQGAGRAGLCGAGVWGQSCVDFGELERLWRRTVRRLPPGIDSVSRMPLSKPRSSLGVARMQEKMPQAAGTSQGMVGEEEGVPSTCNPGSLRRDLWGRLRRRAGGSDEGVSMQEGAKCPLPPSTSPLVTPQNLGQLGAPTGRKLRTTASAPVERKSTDTPPPLSSRRMLRPTHRHADRVLPGPRASGATTEQMGGKPQEVVLPRSSLQRNGLHRQLERGLSLQEWQLEAEISGWGSFGKASQASTPLGGWERASEPSIQGLLASPVAPGTRVSRGILRSSTSAARMDWAGGSGAVAGIRGMRSVAEPGAAHTDTTSAQDGFHRALNLGSAASCSAPWPAQLRRGEGYVQPAGLYRTSSLPPESDWLGGGELEGTDVPGVGHDLPKQQLEACPDQGSLLHCQPSMPEAVGSSSSALPAVQLGRCRQHEGRAVSMETLLEEQEQPSTPRVPAGGTKGEDIVSSPQSVVLQLPSFWEKSSEAVRGPSHLSSASASPATPPGTPPFSITAQDRGDAPQGLGNGMGPTRSAEEYGPLGFRKQGREAEALLRRTQPRLQPSRGRLKVLGSGSWDSIAESLQEEAAGTVAAARREPGDAVAGPTGTQQRRWRHLVRAQSLGALMASLMHADSGLNPLPGELPSGEGKLACSGQSNKGGACTARARRSAAWRANDHQAHREVTPSRLGNAGGTLDCPGQVHQPQQWSGACSFSTALG